MAVFVDFFPQIQPINIYMDKSQLFLNARSQLRVMGIPQPTINHVLDRLLDLKKIERLGLGRGTRYRVIV